MHRTYCTALLFFVFLEPAFTQDSAGELARILRDKGVITNSDLEKLESTPSEERVRLLASLLEVKGVLSAAEVAAVTKTHLRGSYPQSIHRLPPRQQSSRKCLQKGPKR